MDILLAAIKKLPKNANAQVRGAADWFVHMPPAPPALDLALTATVLALFLASRAHLPALPLPSSSSSHYALTI